MSNPERLRELIAKMSLKNNFWGYLFSRVRRVADDQLPSIMGVGPEPDGTLTLYYHPELVNKTDDDTIGKVLEHEGMHILNKHIPRSIRMTEDEINEGKKGYKRLIWNFATDCSINETINMPKKIKIGDMELVLCHPEKYNLPPKHASEWYYSKLLEQIKYEEVHVCSCGGKGKDDKEGDGQQGSGKGQMCDKCGGLKADDGLDCHDKWGKGLEGVSDKNTLARKMENYTKDVISDSVKNFNRSRGNMPGYLEELIKDALKPPQAPYYQIIRKLVKGTRLSKFKRALTKINRKRTYVFEIGSGHNPKISPFPGRTRDFSFHVCVMIDTSGSMSKDDVLEALGSCKDIMEKDKHCMVTVIECDTNVKKEYEIKRLRDIQMNVKGRGGTILLPGLLRAKEIQSDVTLCFTDGFCENFNEVKRSLLPKKLIWVVGKGGTTDTLDKVGFIVRVDK